jgi:hypothetical protein
VSEDDRFYGKLMGLVVVYMAISLVVIFFLEQRTVAWNGAENYMRFWLMLIGMPLIFFQFVLGVTSVMFKPANPEVNCLGVAVRAEWLIAFEVLVMVVSVYLLVSGW